MKNKALIFLSLFVFTILLSCSNENAKTTNQVLIRQEIDDAFARQRFEDRITYSDDVEYANEIYTYWYISYNSKSGMNGEKSGFTAVRLEDNYFNFNKVHSDLTKVLDAKYLNLKFIMKLSKKEYESYVKCVRTSSD